MVCLWYKTQCPLFNIISGEQNRYHVDPYQLLFFGYQQCLTLKLSNLYYKKGQKLRTCMPWQSWEVLVQPCSFLRGWRQCRHLTANRRTKPRQPFFSAFLPLYASRAEWCALILILLAILCAPYNSQWAKLQRFKLHSIEKPCMY